MSTQSRFLEFTSEWIAEFWQQHVGYPDHDACWLWTGRKHNKGYGFVRLPIFGAQAATHRVAYWLTYGEDLQGRVICHRCPGGENTACDNPHHLYNGTHWDNTQDLVAAGRKPIPPRKAGEAHHAAKVTADMVRAIRTAYTGAYGEQQRLADQYGITQSQVWNILHGKSWSHIGGGLELRADRMPASKLTREQVNEIRAEYNRRGGRYGVITALATEFDMSASTIKKIVHGLTWRES
jgi:hypothetical protein